MRFRWRQQAGAPLHARGETVLPEGLLSVCVVSATITQDRMHQHLDREQTTTRRGEKQMNNVFCLVQQKGFAGSLESSGWAL